jgi:hypothetical protein
MLQATRRLTGALVAVLVMSFASSAVASEFHSEVASTTLKGAGGLVTFTTTAGSFECEGSELVGTQSGATAASLDFSPGYWWCVGPFGTAPQIFMNGCQFRLHPGAEASATTFAGTLDVVCPAGISMQTSYSAVGTRKCTVDVPSQTGLEGVVFHNEGAGASRDIRVSIELSEVKYTQTPGTGFGKCESAEDSNGALTIEGMTVKGYEGATQKGIWVA